MVDISRHMDAVARHLLGKPNRSLSSKRELRYGAHGSLSIDLEKGIFFDHENNIGGGVLDLIRLKTGFANGAAVDWLRNELGIEIDNNSKPHTPKKRIAAIYQYQDEAGILLFEVVRYDPKAFSQRKPNGRGGYDWSLGETRRVPFHLPQLLEANGRTIHIVEGEKDVLSLERLGLAATCNSGGAGKWRADYAQFFVGADVVILPDNDPAGDAHAKQVAQMLDGVASHVHIVQLPGLRSKEDVSDWIDAGGTAEALATAMQRGATDSLYRNRFHLRVRRDPKTG